MANRRHNLHPDLNRKRDLRGRSREFEGRVWGKIWICFENQLETRLDWGRDLDEHVLKLRLINSIPSVL